MKKSFALALIAAALTATTFGAAQADTYVRGHTRSNGTYVAPHYRSSPDSNYNNNWSVRGNINPYTGQAGTHAPHHFSDLPAGTAGGSWYTTPSIPFASPSSPFGNPLGLDLD